MTQALYRRKAILARIHKALDAFYLLQKIDWEYDVRSTIEKILGLALSEIEFEEGKRIERGLVIVRSPEAGELEVHAGWRADDADLSFSRTVVQRTIETGEPILCENAKEDPRFMEAESIKRLELLSLICVPLRFEGASIGALYVESKLPRSLFNETDLEFLTEFTDAISPYVKAALTHEGHVRAIRRLQEEVSGRYAFQNIVGRSRAMQTVFELVKIAAGVDRTVLLTGESGSGKELVARAIHYNGRRRHKPFVVVDCSSLAEHLLESELFGHRRGAFTGASSDKIGAFEGSDGGTIFLDEISDASKSLQQKLRRVLQEGEIRRVGENLSRKVDVRVICATNKDLRELAEKGDFMRDLYYRIAKFPIHLPPLRERKEDIPPLVEHFLAEAARESGGPPKAIHPEALQILMERDWSANNVRELKNAIDLCVDFTAGAEIAPATLQRVLRIQRGEPDAGSEDARGAGPPGGFRPAGAVVGIDRAELRRLIDAAKASGRGEKQESVFYRVQLEASALAIIEGLRAAGWKLRPAARLLGLSPTKLRCDLKEFLEERLRRSGGDAERVSKELDVPSRVLDRKAADLGIGKIEGRKP